MKPRDWAKLTWVVGGLVFLAGEGTSAFDARKGNTLSEFWRDLPRPAKDASLIIIGAVLGHWCWPMPVSEVNIENVTVEAEHSDG